MEELIKIAAGVAGFGGGVVALPVLVWVFGVREAIPILSISQLLSAASRVWLHRDGINWPVVRYFALGALPLSVLGSFIFISIDTTILVRILGVMMLLLVVYTRLPTGRDFTMKLWGFTPLGAATGFGSAFLGIPGPFAAVFYLAHGLAASPYIGTSSLGMGMIQVPKLVIFGADGLLTLRVLLLGIGLGAIAAAAYLGRLILKKVPEKMFPRIITAMLLVSGIVFLVRG